MDIMVVNTLEFLSVFVIYSSRSWSTLKANSGPSLKAVLKRHFMMCLVRRNYFAVMICVRATVCEEIYHGTNINYRFGITTTYHLQEGEELRILNPINILELFEIEDSVWDVLLREEGVQLG
jgi:hypothetical protein